SALRGPVKLHGLPEPEQAQTRLFVAFSAMLANAAMAATLFVAIGVSAVWSFEPAWVNEAGVYSLLGTTAAWLFVVFMLFGFLPERVKEFFSLRGSWRRWRSRYRDVAWPTLRAVLSRIIEVALGLLIVWLMIDQVLTLPTVLKPEGIFIGMLLVLRGFLALLD